MQTNLAVFVTAEVTDAFMFGATLEVYCIGPSVSLFYNSLLPKVLPCLMIK